MWQGRLRTLTDDEKTKYSAAFCNPNLLVDAWTYYNKYEARARNTKLVSVDDLMNDKCRRAFLNEYIVPAIHALVTNEDNAGFVRNMNNNPFIRVHTARKFDSFLSIV
jgi:hypothetical protein